MATDLLKYALYNRASMLNAGTLTAGKHFLYQQSVPLVKAAASGWSHDLNGVSNASIAKVNGVAIASISKINGVS